ncbi:MAG TPA: SRPBCC family protein [Nocardioidaceae bacterium]|nr:SRPBCC family protein [Nocardioidaceae bacterium]
MTTAQHGSTHQEATIEAVPDMPVIKITRDFDATPAQLVRAHTDRDLFVRWIGPNGMGVRIDRWNATTGGSYRYGNSRDGEEFWFYGSFHYVGEDRLVQTFTWEGMPEGVSLETMTFEDLGGGRSRMVSTAVVETIEARDAMLASGMEVGINDGYAKLDALLAEGAA